MNNAMNNNMQANTGARINTGNKTNKPVRKVLSKEEQNNRKYTENWINVKKISNGILYNTEGVMITGVKIRPKNIFILDRYSMDNTLVGLMNFYNTIDYEFWLVIADRPVDIAVYQAELQLLYNRASDPTIRKIIGQDLDKGDYFVNNSVVDTEYYLLFKERNVDMMQKKLRGMINGLAAAGLVASQTSSDDLRMILDNFLNGGRNFESGTVMPL
ncbi:MAG: hypothetical protein PUC23_05170 [bacterium]|nr:hypothetical protein [bacterium]